MICSASIIVPIYNAEKYLSKCLMSLVSQQMKDIEFILVDDGSTDNSAVVCQEYVKSDHRFRYYYKENGGVSSARNYGISLARGRYIGFVDADDTIHPQMFSILMMGMKSADMIVCGYQLNNKHFLDNSHFDSEFLTWGVEYSIKQFILNEAVQGFVWNKFFKSDIVKRNNIAFNTDLHICEDLDYCIRYALCCRKINFTPIPLYNYVMNSSGAMSRPFNAKQLTLINAFDEMKKIPSLSVDSVKLLMYRQVIMLLSLLRKMLKFGGGCDLDYNVIVHAIRQNSKGFIFSVDTSIKYRLAYILFKLNPQLLRFI